jgi:hypothetical protein
MLQAVKRTPAVPIVRVPWNAQGIIRRARRRCPRRDHPMVNSPGARAVDACRYARRPAAFGR